jgi:Asp-tRNA(Asn)/Glu-tRNA(Gln) amidotransferase A subunit family amidase
LRALAQALASGQLTARDSTAALLARSRARDESVRAWIALDEARALALADACDRQRAADKPLGPLHGVAVGVKDIIDTADLPTECGTRVFAGRRPERDAVVVERLRQAGAFVLGKTVTTEFAFLHPGKTRNPRQPEHTPGGSSSGSAAAVAAGFVPAAIGTQTNGSVIRPAAFCGVVGFKPTLDLIPYAGTLHFSETLDTVGVFAVSVADCAYFAAPLAEGEAISPEVARLERAPRLAALPHYPWNVLEPEATAQFETALDALRAAGARVDTIALPEAFAEAKRIQRTIMMYEAARRWHGMQDTHRAELSAVLNEALDEGRAIADDAYRAALAARAALAERAHDLFERHDAIVTPPAPGAAPHTLTATGDPSFCTLWSLIGAPAIAVPSGWSRAGLPFGMQLAADCGADDALLRIAQWCETALRFEHRA